MGWLTFWAFCSLWCKERVYKLACNNNKKPSLEKGLEEKKKKQQTNQNNPLLPPTKKTPNPPNQPPKPWHAVEVALVSRDGLSGENSVLTVFGSYSSATVLYRCFRCLCPVVLFSSLLLCNMKIQQQSSNHVKQLIAKFP